MNLMTADEFVKYANDVLFGDGAECLFESIAEAKSEIARFGDAGPGRLHSLRQSVREYNSIGARWSKLTGSRFDPISLPYPQ